MDLETNQWGIESMERASSEQCSRASSGDHASTSSGLSCSLADHVSKSTVLSTYALLQWFTCTCMPDVTGPSSFIGWAGNT